MSWERENWVDDDGSLEVGTEYTADRMNNIEEGIEEKAAQGPEGPAGPEGAAGPEGPEGKEGPQGPKGDTGSAGATGEKGPKGDAGATGATGPEGPQGEPGEQGPKGDTGATGPEGPKGEKGDTGAKGEKGDTGATGATGEKGAKGDTGATGPEGPQGKEGKEGPQGVKGDTGATGEKGAKGDTGSTGPEGPKGSTGATGAEGPPTWTPVIDSSIKQINSHTFEHVTSVEGDATLRSADGFARGCFVSFTTVTTNKGYEIGLNSDPATDEGVSGIDYGFRVGASGKVTVFESGSGQTTEPAEITYVAGDVFTITYDGETVRYLKNGVQVREVARAIGSPLFLDTWWKEEGGKVEQLHFGPMGEKGAKGSTGSTGPEGAKGSTGSTGSTGATGAAGATDWTPIIDSSIKQIGSNTFEKSTNVEGDATLRSTEGYRRGCYLSFVAGTTNKGFGLGLNTDPATDEAFTGIDYWINCTAGGTLIIRESGTEKVSGVAYSVGDVLAITFDGATVRYWKNGELLREVARAIGSPLFLDSWWNQEGGKAENVHFGPMGEKGETGEKGATGSTGSTGEKGSTGSTGATGEKGNGVIVVKLATGTALPENTRTGNVLEANANGALPNIDGAVTLPEVNDLILVKNQSGATQNNGIYKVVSLGSAGTKWKLERAPEMDASGDLFTGMLIGVAQGSERGGSIWRLTTAGPFTLNTTTLNFEGAVVAATLHNTARNLFLRLLKEEEKTINSGVVEIGAGVASIEITHGLGSATLVVQLTFEGTEASVVRVTEITESKIKVTRTVTTAKGKIHWIAIK